MKTDPGRGAVVIALPILGALGLIAAPFLISSPYVLTVLTNALIFTMLAMSLNVIYGYAGLLSFAQVGFWGLGGYTAAIVATRLGLDPWTGIVAAAILSAAVAVVLGAIALRLSNHAFVIVSIAFTLLLQLLSQEWVEVTNGPMGIPGLPVPVLGFGSWAIQIDSVDRYYYLVLAIYAASIALMQLVLSSRIGRTLRLLRHDEVLARSYGVRVTGWKLFAAGFAAAFAAIAGAINVFFVTIVDPSIFDIYYTQLMLVIVIVGGLGSFWPVIVAGIVLTILPELLRTPSEIRMINYGIILILAVVLFPGGFAGILRSVGSRRQRYERARGMEAAND
jgi:ABC-type branched-subunit amino acid transport system permease subunit